MATDGLTLQDVLDDSLRFWGLDGNEDEQEVVVVDADDGADETKAGAAARSEEGPTSYALQMLSPNASLIISGPPEASEEPTPSPLVRRNSVGQEIRMRPKSPDVMLHAAAGPGAIWTPRQLA